jgi:hypothetical protein
MPYFIKGLGDIKEGFIVPFGARQLLGKHVPAAMNTRNKSRIVGDVIFFAVPVLSRREPVGLCIPLLLLSVKTFPRRRRIDGGIIFYACGILNISQTL